MKRLSPYLQQMQDEGIRCGKCGFGRMRLEPSLNPEVAMGVCQRCGHRQAYRCPPGMARVRLAGRGKRKQAGRVIRVDFGRGNVDG